MTAIGFDDVDDDPLYLPILDNLFDTLAGKKLGRELKEAARWVLGRCLIATKFRYWLEMEV